MSEEEFQLAKATNTERNQLRYTQELDLVELIKFIHELREAHPLASDEDKKADEASGFEDIFSEFERLSLEDNGSHEATQSQPTGHIEEGPVKRKNEDAEHARRVAR